MVSRSRNADSSLELDDARVCVLSNTTTQLHLASYFGAITSSIKKNGSPLRTQCLRPMIPANAMWSPPMSPAFAMRLQLGHPGEHVILPDVISKDPLAPVVRQKDDQWLLIVK